VTVKLAVFRSVLTVVLETLSVGLLAGGIGFLLGDAVGFDNFFAWGLVIGFFGSLILEFTRLLEAYGRYTFGEYKIKNIGYGLFVKTAENRKSVKK